jgi:signal transduction histidine kinase
MGKSVSGESLVADIVISGDPYALPAEIEENLFRIAQEALTNVVRHSGATRVEIELGFEDGRVSLRVEDNGCGRSDSEESDGFGTTSMRQRAARIDACFDMSSKPGEGTRVELTAPIPHSRDIQYHRWNSN